MERNYGAEIVRTFGVRLKKVYDLDEVKLPAEIETLLNRLKAAEQAVVEQGQHASVAVNGPKIG